MKKITHWRAKRAGGRITLYGKDETGADIRVPHVDVVEGPAAPGEATIATDKDGERYALAADHG